MLLCTHLLYCVRVWAWGSNEWSQLGMGEVTADQDTPTHVALLDAHKVAMVAAGNRHSVVVSKLGKLLTFGSSECVTPIGGVE